MYRNEVAKQSSRWQPRSPQIWK